MTSADVLDVDRRRPRSAPATAPNAVAAADQIAARVITERRGMVTGHRDDAIERIVSKTVSGDAIERIAGDTDRPWLVAVDYSIIAFITEPAAVRQTLEHLGEPTRPPRFAPARGPPLWEAVTAAPPADHDPRWDPSAQPLPQIEFDQRLTW